MSRFSRDRRVIVIGAGSSGLVCAINLARAGLDVTVLEHAGHPGGASSSSQVTLPGYVHDHCAGFNPMTVASPAIRELDVEAEGVQWVTPDTIMAHPFLDGSAIELRHDLDATVASLDAAHPGAGVAWESLVTEMRPVLQPLVEAVLGPLNPSLPPAQVLLGLRRQSLTLARRMIGSIQALGEDIFDGAQRPTAWLSGVAQHSGLPPSTAGSGAFGLLLTLLAHSHGWPFPAGGEQSLADALVRIAERDGAEVRCSASVERILVKDGRVRGVRLSSGEELGAPDVVSSVSARPLLKMLGPNVLPARLSGRLRKWRYGTAAFKLDYALSGPVPWASPAAAGASVVHVGGELEALTVAAEAGMGGRVPDWPALVIGQHTLFDRTRVPDDGQTLYCYAHMPARSGASDEEIIGRVEAQLERFAPGFSGVVRARATRNAAETEADNPSLVDGDLGGGVLELDQQLIFRPAPEMSRHRTPVRGLYVCGASVHPGGSVQGMGGRSAARALITDRRLRPWRA